VSAARELAFPSTVWVCESPCQRHAFKVNHTAERKWTTHPLHPTAVLVNGTPKGFKLLIVWLTTTCGNPFKTKGFENRRMRDVWQLTVSTFVQTVPLRAW